MSFVSHMHFLLQVQFVKFKISAEMRLEIMFGNSFGLPNLLARKNKLGLLRVFQKFVNLLSFDGIFGYDKQNIFYENIEYCIIRSYYSKYVFFSYKCMFYLFIIIFLTDTCQFSKIDTSIIFYITFNLLHHFPRKLYGALEESDLYNIIYRNQGFY